MLALIRRGGTLVVAAMLSGCLLFQPRSDPPVMPAVPHATGPLMEVVLRNHTRDEATLLLTTRDGVGGSQSEGLAAPCDGTAAGGPIDPQWEIRVDGAQLMGHADPRPDVMDGEVLQIVIDVNAEGAAVALDVVPADQSVFAENGEALRTLIDAGGRCGS